jgi:hypothetical protein
MDNPAPLQATMAEPAFRGGCELIYNIQLPLQSDQGIVMKCTRMNKSFRSATAEFVGALLLASLTIGGNSALADDVATAVTPAIATPLTLVNGWTNAPFGTNNAAVQTFNGIVHLKGAIANGTASEVFFLPAGFRPASTVYVPIDLCNSQNGRLIIQPSGEVDVQAENLFSYAQCFTSLDGVSFAPNSMGFTPLTLINGWTNYTFGTSNAAVRTINGVVHFKGAIATAGTNTEPFVLPVGSRPAKVVYVPVDLCNSANGRLIISPNGVVIVQAEISFASAQCFTSLDGAWFVAATKGYANLKLLHGWTDTIYSTAKPAADNAHGAFPVYLKGAISTGGTNAVPFRLPLADRPVTNVYVPIDLCNATKGRLLIQASGLVTVQPETSFSNAQCFTSLDGASFVQ